MHSAYLTVCARGALLVGAVLVALAAGTAPVYAWTVEHDGGGRHRVSRDATDTGSATVVAYLKQGVLSSTGTHWSGSSFDDTSTGASFAGATVVTIPVDATTEAFEYITAPGWMVLWALPDGEVVVNAASYWSQPVYLTTSSSNSAYSSYVTNTPVTVLNSAASTVSVAGTLPVNVSAISGSTDVLTALVAVAGLCLGLTLWGRLTWK